MPNVIELHRKPNADLVGMLRDVLAQAEAGEVSSLALTIIDHTGEGHYTYTHGLAIIGAVHVMLTDMTRDD